MEKKTKSWQAFFKIIKVRTLEAEISSSSVVVAYYILLSLFPFLITLGNILPYLNLNPETVLPYLQEVIPSTIYQELEPAMVSLLTRSSTSLLSFSALATLWSASRSINALQKAVNKAYGIEKKRNFIISKILSFFMLLLLVIALFIAVLVLGVGQDLLEFIQSQFQVELSFLETFARLKWPTVLIGLFLIMTFIYRILPNGKIHFRNVWPGAIFASLGWVVLSQVFSLYLTYFSPEMASYQIIGSVIIMMLWLNIAASIIILGGVLNAAIVEFRHGEGISPREFKNHPFSF